jgi:hypothetical protein
MYVLFLVYGQVARNCWIAAAVYVVMIFLSYMCIVKARKTAKRMALLDEDDDLFCTTQGKTNKNKIV